MSFRPAVCVLRDFRSFAAVLRQELNHTDFVTQSDLPHGF